MLEPEVTTKMMDRLTNRTPILHDDLTNREKVLLLIAEGKVIRRLRMSCLLHSKRLKPMYQIYCRN